MREIKRLCDPDGVLNPGVLLSDDPRGPPAAPQDRADGRGGGGPLRRVRLLRAGLPQPRPHHHAPAAHRAAPGDRRRRRPPATPRWSARTRPTHYDYDAVQTCAVDGMCQTACPVLINTGDLVKRLRARGARPGRVDRLADGGRGTGAPPPGRMARGLTWPARCPRRCPRPPPGPPARCSAPTGYRGGSGTCRRRRHRTPSPPGRRPGRRVRPVLPGHAVRPGARAAPAWPPRCSRSPSGPAYGCSCPTASATSAAAPPGRPRDSPTATGRDARPGPAGAARGQPRRRAAGGQRRRVLHRGLRAAARRRRRTCGSSTRSRSPPARCCPG